MNKRIMKKKNLSILLINSVLGLGLISALPLSLTSHNLVVTSQNHQAKMIAHKVAQSAGGLATPWYFASQLLLDTNLTTKDNWWKLTWDLLKLENPLVINGAKSFNYPRVKPEQWQHYPELVKFSQAADNFKKLIINKVDKTSKAFYDAKRELDNLGYVCLNVESMIPLNSFLTPEEKEQYKQNKTLYLYSQTQKPNDLYRYKYIVRYSFKARPLQLSDLSKYINISYSSSNKDNPSDELANRTVNISFNTKQMQADLGGMPDVNQDYWTLQENSLNGFFDVTYDEFWNAVIDLVNQQTPNVSWCLSPQSFRFIDNNSANTINYKDVWNTTNKWTYTTNDDDDTFNNLNFQVNITSREHNIKSLDLNNAITFTKGKTTINGLGDISTQLAATEALNKQINDLKNKYDATLAQLKQLSNEIATTRDQINPLVQKELDSSAELKLKYDTINQMYNDKIAEVINSIKAKYEAYLKENNYVSNGFISSTSTKSFDYKNELIQLQTLYTQKKLSLSNLITDETIKTQLKTQAQALTSEVQSKINALNMQLNQYQQELTNLKQKNTQFKTFVDELGNTTSNQNATVSLKLDANAKLAISDIQNELPNYWLVNKNPNTFINKADFIAQLNQIVNQFVNPLTGCTINLDLSMFKLQDNMTNKVISGYQFKDARYTVNAKVVYSTSNGILTKWQLDMQIAPVTSASARVANNDSATQAKQNLQQMQNLSTSNQTTINNLDQDINNQVADLKQAANYTAQLAEASLPTVDGTSDKLLNVDKLITNYQTINSSSTKLNPGFIGVLAGSIAALILLVTAIVVLSILLKRKKNK